MKSGRKPPNPATKKLAGTFRGDRHANIVELVPPLRDEPVMPEVISEEAKAIWLANLARVVACGATSADSNHYEIYCEAMASFRAAMRRGEVPKGNLMTQIRTYAEGLGIAGLKSRLGRTSAAPVKATSAFSVLKP